MKKLVVSSVLVLLVLLQLAGGVLAAPSSATLVPLKGTFAAQETDVPDLQTMIMSVDGVGSGNSTQMGLYSVHYTASVNMITAFGSNLNVVYTATNGDKIFTAGYGQGTIPDANHMVSITEWQTITGGTGRFAGASGSITLSRTINLSTGVTSGTFVGTINVP